jgi:hypothetical protein
MAREPIAQAIRSAPGVKVHSFQVADCAPANAGEDCARPFRVDACVANSCKVAEWTWGAIFSKDATSGGQIVRYRTEGALPIQRSSVTASRVDADRHQNHVTVTR